MCQREQFPIRIGDFKSQFITAYVQGIKAIRK